MSYIFTQLAADALTGANQNPLNPAVWTPPTGVDPLQVFNHAAQCTSTAPDNAELYTGITWPDDQWVEYKLVLLTDDSENVNAALRSNADESTCYFFSTSLIFSNNTLSIACQRFVDNADITVFQLTNVPFSFGDIFRFGIIGSTLLAYQNGTLLHTDSNSDIASGTAGMDCENNVVGQVRFSNFAGGSITQTADSSGSAWLLNENSQQQNAKRRRGF